MHGRNVKIIHESIASINEIFPQNMYSVWLKRNFIFFPTLNLLILKKGELCSQGVTKRQSNPTTGLVAFGVLVS
jgi:hypothetical protein